MESALRSVRRFLKKAGYLRENKKGMICYRLKEGNSRKRDAYVQLITDDKKDRSRITEYMDESYNTKSITVMTIVYCI